jgi:putative ABC transport system permease protein
MVQDLLHAARALGRHPAYFFTALLTLALGIGFSTATFSVIHAVLLRPLPYSNPEQLLRLRERALPRFPQFSVSPGHYLTWQAETTMFEGIAAWGTQLVNLDAGGGEPERIRADRVTANLFPLLGVKPVLGRAFSEADDETGAPQVAILSYSAWQRRFGGRADVIARSVRVDRQVVPIVGVMPAGFVFPAAETEMWVPMAFTAHERTLYGSHYLSAVARMKPGVTLDGARADLDRATKRLWEINPGSKGWEVLVDPLHEFSVQGVKRALLVLLGAVALVLLIACVNVANLLLARGAARQKELAIRAAIGASRVRLIRQLLVEQVALAAVSAAAGVLLAAWLLRALLSMLPDALPRQEAIGLDWQVLAFAVALAALTPILFGLVPAVQASRPDLRELMALGGRQGGAVPGRGLRRALVVVEVALAMALLVGAALLIRSFDRLADVSPGFAPAQAVVGSVSLPAARYPAGVSREQFFGDLLARTSELPQVRAAAVTQSVPMVNDFVSSFEIEGRPLPDNNKPVTNFYAVSPGYFEAMNIPILRGRAVTAEDRQGTARVVVVNQALADEHFPGVDPIGRRIRVSQGTDSNAWKEIVGIAGNVRQYGLGERISMQVYEPHLQHPYFSTFTLVVRTESEDPTVVVPDLRRIVRSLDPELPLSRVRTLESIVGASIRPQRFSTVLIGMFSGAALLLAAVGLYGVLAYTVGQRRQEIAIRIAHGATPRDILQLVVADGLAMSAIGIAIGLAGAFVLRRVIEGLLFGVSAEDPLTYGVVALLLVLVTTLASIIPAWRATRVSPLAALRG